MIYIALGANLPSRFGTPAETLEAAKQALIKAGIGIVAQSSMWLTAPVPYDPNVPYYYNAVIAVKTSLEAESLLDLMLDIEEEFGRVRTYKNAPRLLDLDLIAYHDEIIKRGEKLIVPHPRMDDRAFVIRPLQEIALEWIHPVTQKSINDLVKALSDDQEAKVLEWIEA